MSVSDLAIVAALIFAWGAVSARLERFDVTAPITFVVAGLVLTHGPLAVLGFAPSHEAVKVLAEVTLVLVLFSDASRVGLRDLRAELGLCLRLLGIGLPLTIGLGMLLALALFGGINIWLALLIGAALAPTDAALGAGVMVNRAVPARIRRLINVESGLNDGIVTPFVLVAVAGAGPPRMSPGPGRAGLSRSWLSAWPSVSWWAAWAAGWSGWPAAVTGSPRVSPARRCSAWRCARTPQRSLCTATASSPRSPAAWRSAARRGGAASRSCRSSRRPGPLVSLLVWLAFGAVAVAPVLEHLTWQLVVYALLSLTVVRMAPVALALAGARLGWATTAFVGWFGPRGLASVVFALIALEDLGEKAASPAVAVITATVLLSVIAHGASAEPLARRYGALPARAASRRDSDGLPEVPTRRLIRRAPAPGAGPAPGTGPAPPRVPG